MITLYDIHKLRTPERHIIYLRKTGGNPGFEKSKAKGGCQASIKKRKEKKRFFFLKEKKPKQKSKQSKKNRWNI